jgi:pimeloyl-ACP methyl ester carboxylesterase
MEGGTLSSDSRDDLVRLLNDELGGVEKGLVPDWVKARFKGMALRWATDKARRERDVLFNAAYPAAGDILLYQSDGQAIRDFIGARIDACEGDVVVMAHSLGGIACVDLLVQQPRPRVKALVTFGSQAPLLYELGALRSLKPPGQLPNTFPRRWINVYDRDDLLSYLAAPIFKPVAKDLQARSGQPFPDSHSAYWDQRDVWERLAEELA